MTFVPVEQVVMDACTHAHSDAPRESCGVVVVRGGKQKYYPCRNMIEGTEHFMMHPEDLACVEDLGVVIAYVHSHPSTGLNPSEADLQGIESTNLPWMIVSPSTGMYTVTEPTGYKPPLYGRQFAHGVFDCYSFVRDAYVQLFKLEIPNYSRDFEWWTSGQDLISQNFESAGFTEVPCNQLQVGDGVLMSFGAQVINHVGLLVEDNMLGHHMTGRLSSMDVYSGLYRGRTIKIVRHKDLA